MTELGGVVTHEQIAAELQRRIEVILHSNTVHWARRGSAIEEALAEARTRHRELDLEEVFNG